MQATNIGWTDFREAWNAQSCLAMLAAAEERDRLRRHFDNLLARIFRDGGHRQQEIADDSKAVEEATMLWVDLVTKAECYDNDDANKLCDELLKERDRLAAENATLRKELADYKDAAEVEARLGDEARKQVAELEHDKKRHEAIYAAVYAERTLEAWNALTAENAHLVAENATQGERIADLRAEVERP